MFSRRARSFVLKEFEPSVLEGRSLALYIHIPFCRKGCHYCDFYFTPRQSLMEPYVEALLKEIELYIPLLSIVPIKTVFFGGGTPSWLPEALWERLWNRLSSLPTFHPVEVTLEANPEDITLDRLRFWKDLGITRLSIGIQSLSPRLLNTLGRWHTPQQAEQAIQWTAQMDFPSWSVDLMFAIPGQSIEDVKRDIDFISSYAVPHISFYGLTLEERTVLYKKKLRAKFIPVEDEVYEEAYLFIYDVLLENGYTWYEISNWARPNHESIHNWSYWLREPYIGLGPSAHSYIPEQRWWNEKNLKAYIEALERADLPPRGGEQLSPTQQAYELWLTRFRTRLGIDKAWVEKEEKIFAQFLRWQAFGWVEEREGSFRLSARGALLADSFVRQIISYSPVCLPSRLVHSLGEV
ncbi:MAG: radical SAM family heme chaperone HemW [Bacteroidia bacterium]|nr:radical SAM family heme chaperone HemW [Bacteroidia bacterium]